ncbi:MAG: methylmalonyl-CoA mutase small subunit [Bacteroidales bacterium]|nr:methylmalonyl-CoA mutase small subunit [Bacteroidales bacterium]
MSESMEKLFSEFSPVSTQEWEDIINKDLKGADYNKKLVWKTMEGFNVKPYYRKEDLDALGYLTQEKPGEYPYARGNSAQNNEWNIVQEIEEADPAQANAIALDALMKGADTVSFNCEQIASDADMNTLLQGIDISICGIHFRNAKNYLRLAQILVHYTDEHKIDKSLVRGCFHFDPIAYLQLHGKPYQSEQEDMRQVVDLHNMMHAFTRFQYITVNGMVLNNAGATIVQELAYVLSSGNTYLTYMTEHGISVDEILPCIGFEMSISSNYFMEIAKLRSARMLWATIANAYHPVKAMEKMNIFSHSSTWNKTIYDPYVNMLRITTEGMSAALGGAGSIALTPFDTMYKPADEFSYRISRNTQILLKEESYFNRVVDPAAGSYYIETLTDSIAENAWNLFNQVEAAGGMTAYVTSGELKAAVEQSCEKRNAEIATRRMVFLGTNQYPNIKESMLDQVSRKAAERTDLSLQPYRGAVPFEELRFATEGWAKEHGRPKVFLFKVGNVAMRQARAGFVTNFFGCAGYEIIEPAGYADIEAGIKDVQECCPQIVAICSSDEEYADYAAEITKRVKQILPQAQCIVAGNPVEQIDALKAAGVDDFIHVKVNLLETLRRYNHLLGIC